MTHSLSVVVFDLDHTLTHHDTYLQYLLGFLLERPWRIVRAWALPFAVAAFVVGKVGNAELKERFLWAILGGVSREELQPWTARFISELLRKGMRRDGMSALQAHKDEGATLILLSASPDIYVVGLGSELGFDDVICTVVEWEHNRVTGKLSGPNMRGEEKAKMLKAIRRRYPNARILAYADSLSDLSMLQLADYGVLVNGTKDAQKLARQKGIDLVVWS